MICFCCCRLQYRYFLVFTYGTDDVLYVSLRGCKMCGTNKPPFSRNILLINKFSDNPPGHVSGTVGSRDPRKTWPCPSWGPPCYRGRSSRLCWTVIARERMHFDSYVAWEWGQRLHWLWNQSIKIFVTETVFYLRQLRGHVIDDTRKISLNRFACSEGA